MEELIWPWSKDTPKPLVEIKSRNTKISTMAYEIGERAWSFCSIKEEFVNGKEQKKVIYKFLFWWN